jgi:hypothetical protein
MKLAVFILLVTVASAFSQTDITPRKSVTWKFNSLKSIGGHTPEILGEPKIVKTDKGKAVFFDGVDDGIFVPVNPLAGAVEFTIEAVFRPDAGGLKEQRWLHIEDMENRESRTLLETRVVGDEWFLDTFIKSGEQRSALYAEDFKHPLGRWYTVKLVFDGKEMRHYVDGKLELTGKLTRKPFGKGMTSIGVRQNKIYWFKGAVLRVKFTNRAVNQTS